MAELILTDEERAAERWSDLDDAALGALLRKKMLVLESAAAQMDRTVATAAALLLCCHAAENDSVQMRQELTGVTQSGRDFGDWEVVVRRMRPASPKS